MSDFDDDEFDSAPNYEKMRGMGFICWREISGTNDNEVCELKFLVNKVNCFVFVQENDDTQVKKKKKRKIDAVEAEPEVETPKKSSNDN